MVVKEKLASLDVCYSITLMNYNGREYCVSASEMRGGEIVMVDTQTKAVSKITGLAAGIMAVVPIPEENGGFLAIQKFYPTFDSKEAEVVHGVISGEIAPVMEAKVTVAAYIPYVHRIALTGRPGARKMIACTLCKDKAFTDDWSQPGSAYLYDLDADMKGTLEKTLVTGITKNHGMFTYEKVGGEYILIAGEQGVWAIDGRYNVSKLCGEPVSDLCMYDVDGDGIDEMLTIAPFHGDNMRIFKAADGGWQMIAEEPISFGHAIWCGDCGGAPLIICCSRGGDMSTKLYRPAKDDGAFVLESLSIDEGVGASNIFVKEDDGAVVFYAANHEIGQVARYTIEL